MSLERYFPRSFGYDQEWAEANSLGENPLFMCESLTEVLELRPGMRVLNLACGHGVSSIFLAREFGVEVWAVDRGTDPTSNARRAEEAGCGGRVFPVRADARALPFAQGWFDAVVCFNAYIYFGTDERYLPFLARHVRSGGAIGIVDACVSREMPTVHDVPAELRQAWRSGFNMLHTIEWWRRHWEKTGLVDVQLAELVPGSRALAEDLVRRFRDDPAEREVIEMFEAEGGNLVGTFRMVARRADVEPDLEEQGTPGEY
jgi:cyclopropane fatty-acyl-phospholipid synthase-like methyltransferase